MLLLANHEINEDIYLKLIIYIQLRSFLNAKELFCTLVLTI